MAEYGLRVKNTNSEIQIDSTFHNLALHSHGELTIPAGNVYGLASNYIDVPQDCVVAFRSDRPCTMRVTPNISGGLRRNHFTVYTRTVSTSKVYWYAFRDPELLSPSGEYGMIVKDSLGDKTFDSRFKYMKVIDFLSGDQSDLVDTPVYSTTINTIDHYYPGATPAVLLGNRGFWWYEEFTSPGPSPDFYTFFFMTSALQDGNRLGLTRYQYAIGPYQTPARGWGLDPDLQQWNMTVIDVSDI